MKAITLEETCVRLEEDLKELTILSWEFEGLVVFLTDLFPRIVKV